MQYTLPRAKAGTALPAKAQKLGQQFTVISGPDAGVYTAMAINPTSWVKTQALPSFFARTPLPYLLADEMVDLNSATEQVLVPPIPSARVVVMNQFVRPAGSDGSELGELSNNVRLAIVPSVRADPVNVQLTMNISYLSIPFAGDYALLGGLDYGVGGEERALFTQEGVGIVAFPCTFETGAPTGPTAIGVPSVVRVVLSGFFW